MAYAKAIAFVGGKYVCAARDLSIEKRVVRLNGRSGTRLCRRTGGEARYDQRTLKSRERALTALCRNRQPDCPFDVGQPGDIYGHPFCRGADEVGNGIRSRRANAYDEGSYAVAGPALQVRRTCRRLNRASSRLPRSRQRASLQSEGWVSYVTLAEVRRFRARSSPLKCAGGGTQAAVTTSKDPMAEDLQRHTRFITEVFSRRFPQPLRRSIAKARRW